MALPEKLYTLRKKSGLSQEQLAEALNVSRQAISGPFFAERVGEISTEVDVALRKSSSACGKNIKSDVVSSGGDARR